MIEAIYSPEAEKALIGSILINPELFKSIDIQPNDFYNSTNREIWIAFQSVVFDEMDIDLLTVTQKLNKKTDLAKFVIDVPTSLNAEYYAEIIRENSRRRALVALAGEIAKCAYDKNSKLETEIPAFMTQLVSGSMKHNGAEHIAGALSKLYSEVQEMSSHPKEIWGIPTGLYDYDILTGGQHAGELTLLSGKPGLGKSILVMQMAVGMAKSYPGAIYEMEMGDTQVIRREVSNVSKIPSRTLKSGNLKNDDWENFVKSIAEIEKLPIYLSDNTGWTTASLRADLIRLKQHGIKWFVVDYIQLLRDHYGKDDSERIGFISIALKNICKDLQLSGLVINSMVKSEMESATPGLSGMRGSGQLVYDADVIIYLVEDQDKNFVKLHFSKFREDTPERFIRLKKDNEFPAFKTLSKSSERSYSLPYKD